jgi:hypothetical protein
MAVFHPVSIKNISNRLDIGSKGSSLGVNLKSRLIGEFEAAFLRLAIIVFPTSRRGFNHPLGRSKIEIVSHAFDEMDSMVAIFCGGEHLGSEGQLGINYHALLSEMHDK